MSYVVSARRWRPQTFATLVGQEHVARPLSNAIRSGQVAHAFLFTGVRGVGKTTAARILAKALNCETGPTTEPCNSCTNCTEIAAANSVDVLEVDGASNTGVDDVREIIENVRYRAAHSRYKIYIIDEVHMLSNSAFNALLKTLEEPPDHVKFIFATTDPHKLPATVQSRCQRYDFRRIPLRLVVERLREITDADGVEVSDRGLAMIAREGEGSMRDAQSLLDQILAYGGEKITDEEVVEALGVADRRLLFDMAGALIKRDAGRALELADEVHRGGHDMRRLARDLVRHFRDVVVARATQGKLLPEGSDEESAALREQSAALGQEEGDRIFRMLMETDREVARSPYPKLVLDVALVRIATMPELLPAADLLVRLEELEGRVRRRGNGTAGGGDGGSVARVARATITAAPPVPMSSSAEASMSRKVATGQAPTADVDPPDWPAFVGFVARERAPLAHYLQVCQGVTVGKHEIRASAPRGFYCDYLKRGDHVGEVEELAKRHFGRPLRFCVEASEGREEDVTARAATRQSPAELEKLARENPVVKAAVDIFGAEVSEVRSRGGRRGEDR